LPGNVADFVILDRDLLRPSPEEILQTRVLHTVWAAKWLILLTRRSFKIAPRILNGLLGEIHGARLNRCDVITS
jgi:hypothetical protein